MNPIAGVEEVFLDKDYIRLDDRLDTRQAEPLDGVIRPDRVAAVAQDVARLEKRGARGAKCKYERVGENS